MCPRYEHDYIVVRLQQGKKDNEASEETENRRKIRYGAPGKVKDEKEIREGYREVKTGTPAFEFQGEVTLVRLDLTSVFHDYVAQKSLSHTY